MSSELLCTGTFGAFQAQLRTNATNLMTGALTRTVAAINAYSRHELSPSVRSRGGWGPVKKASYGH